MKVQLLEFRDEHRRYAIKRRASLALNVLEDAQGIECLERHQRRCVRVRAQHTDDAAEAVKEGNRHTNLVLRCESEPFRKPVSVVDYVAVGKHYTLREAGRARGVLHVDHCVEIL